MNEMTPLWGVGPVPASGRRTIEHVDEVLRWFDEGCTPTEVAERYFRKYHESYTPEAFGGLYKRIRGTSPVYAIDGPCPLIPWGDLGEDRSSYHAGLLRAEWRRRRGLPLTAKTEATLDSLLRRLEAEDLVITFDPTSELRWGYVPRRPGVDEDIIREPDGRPHGRRMP